MSGIFGYFLRAPETAEQSKQRLKALDVWNRNYGHESSGLRRLDNYGMGCHLEHFSDAFPWDDPVLQTKNGWAVIDALLYNREELMDGLGLREDRLISDERLLLRWIEDKGYPALKDVNGDFAGAVWDETACQWTLFRDHMGVRPLYYYQDAQVFAFSTDIRGLMAMPGMDAAINEEQLYLRMMGANTLTLCQTEFEKVRCLKPGCFSVVRSDHPLREIPYWEICRRKIRMKNEQDYQQELRRLIEDSVRRRLNAVPGIIGAELSGGLDSSVIDILINRMGREGRYVSWSIPPEGHPIQQEDERQVLEDICRQENIRCQYLPWGQRPIIDPTNDPYPPFINTLDLGRTAVLLREEGARVVFTGHGGDEGVSHRAGMLELWVHGEYLAYFREMWPTTKGKKLRLLRTLKKCFVWVRDGKKKWMQPWHSDISSMEEFLNKDFKERMAHVTFPKLEFAYAPELHIQRGGVRSRLDNVALQGAEHGMRYLLPFLDYRVMDFAVSIPRWLYVRGKWNRYIYREAFKDILPQSLYDVRYKDFASTRNYKKGEKTKIDLTIIRKMIAQMDWELWGDYLDFDAIEAVFNQIPEEPEEEQLHKLIYQDNALLLCSLTQNLQKNSVKWVAEHE